MSRTVFHIDMDAYFVAVERLSFPWLRGRPVIVGGRSLRSVVASCSYEAREMGVSAGMPMVQALRLAPDAALVSGSHESYASYSRRVVRVLAGFSPMVEPVSIDEAFMDVTGVPGSDAPLGLAREVQRAVLSETGLWGSVGVAGNRFLAKMASKRAKPRGVVLLTPDDIGSFPVNAIWGVGPRSGARLRSLGIERIGDLRRFTRMQLRGMMGGIHGDRLFFLCRGIDDAPVVPARDAGAPDSIGNEQTFPVDFSSPEEYLPVLSGLCQKVARRARDKGLVGSTLTLRYRLSNLRRKSRATGLPVPTDSYRVIYPAARSLALTAIRSRIRLIGVCLTSLSPAAGVQLDLFSCPGTDVDGVEDEVRRKYGERALSRGRVLTGERRAALSLNAGAAV